MIRCMGVYKDGVRTPGSNIDIDTADATAARASIAQLVKDAKDAGGYAWLSLPDPAHNEVSMVAETFGLDPLLVEDSFCYPIRSNGKTRLQLEFPIGLDPGGVAEQVLAHPEVQARLEGRPPRKVIVVPGRIVNIVV